MSQDPGTPTVPEAEQHAAHGIVAVQRQIYRARSNAALRATLVAAAKLRGRRYPLI